MKYTKKVKFENRASETLYSPATVLVTQEISGGGVASKLLMKSTRTLDEELEIKGDSITGLTIDVKP